MVRSVAESRTRQATANFLTTPRSGLIQRDASQTGIITCCKMKPITEMDCNQKIQTASWLIFKPLGASTTNPNSSHTKYKINP